MPIREESFRIGCGRYIQGAGCIGKLGDEVGRLGTSSLIIGGETALGITKTEIENAICKKCNNYEFLVYSGTCNKEYAKELAESAVQKGYNVIVGVGGGVICDFAKLVGYFAKSPVINVPTSTATCAAYTPLSVCYTADGRTVGTVHYEQEVNCVIVDTEIIAGEPVRLFLAGVFDSLAKFVEIKHRFNEETKEYPIGLDYAYVMSKYSHKLLNDKMQKCIDDMKKGEISDDVENIIFTTIAATGVISGIARGSNQTALAHKIYETSKYFFCEKVKGYLHGEMVGVGLILQNHFNHEEDNNKYLIEVMKKYNMPYRITDIGIDATEETLNAFYEKICHSSAIDEGNEEECRRLKVSLRYLWDIK